MARKSKAELAGTLGAVRVRGRRKHPLVTPPEAAPEPDDYRAENLAPIIKTSFLEAFEELGGVAGLVKWGRHNPSAFYKTLATLAPALDRHAKGAGLVVQVAAFGDLPPTAPRSQNVTLDGSTDEASDDPAAP